MSKAVPYKAIERLLTQELGFRLTREAGSHRLFKRPNTEAFIVLPMKQIELPLHQVAYIRATLVGNELISEEEFDRLLSLEKMDDSA